MGLSIWECKQHLEEFPQDKLVHKRLIELLMKNNSKDAPEAINQAVIHCGEDCDFENYKGLYFKTVLDLEKAKHCYTRALRLSANSIESSSVWLNIGAIFSCQGDIENFIKCCVKATRIFPDRTEPWTILAFLSNYYSESQLYRFPVANLEKKNHEALHRDVILKMYRGVQPIDMHFLVTKNIGYITGDLYGNACSNFMTAILVPGTFVYSTKKFDCKYPCEYRNISSLDDSEVVELFKKDSIGHLVDLSGFTMGHRNCLVYCLQNSNMRLYSYLGYPADLGIPKVRRITDQYSEEFSNQNNTNIKLPGFFLCYKNKYQDLTVCYTPSDTITFGSFAKLEKINSEVIKVWKLIMSNCKERGLKARFVIKSRYFESEPTRNIWFEKLGPGFELLSGALDDRSHMYQYNQLDIQLDTWPYSGTTVSCDSLFMNVPVITLEGKRHVSRVTGSLLTAMGLSELIARTTEEYIDRAIEVAQRSREFNVREKFMKVMDEPAFREKFFGVFKK